MPAREEVTLRFKRSCGTTVFNTKVTRTFLEQYCGIMDDMGPMTSDWEELQVLRLVNDHPLLAPVELQACFDAVLAGEALVGGWVAQLPLHIVADFLNCQVLLEACFAMPSVSCRVDKATIHDVRDAYLLSVQHGPPCLADLLEARTVLFCAQHITDGRVRGFALRYLSTDQKLAILANEDFAAQERAAAAASARGCGSQTMITRWCR